MLSFIKLSFLSGFLICQGTHRANDFIKELIPYRLNFSLCHRCLFQGLGEKKVTASLILNLALISLCVRAAFSNL